MNEWMNEWYFSLQLLKKTKKILLLLWTLSNLLLLFCCCCCFFSPASVAGNLCTWAACKWRALPSSTYPACMGAPTSGASPRNWTVCRKWRTVRSSLTPTFWRPSRKVRDDSGAEVCFFWSPAPSRSLGRPTCLDLTSVSCHFRRH